MSLPLATANATSSTSRITSAAAAVTTASATANNNMNSKVNKRLDRVPVNLGRNGTTPSGKPRLFVCNVCTRAFARHEHLKRHERSHTKEKPFHCGVCQRQFSRRDLLLRHAQKLHAGCDDAVKRLRRRSSRSKSTTNEKIKEEDEDEDEDDQDEPNHKRIKLESTSANPIPKEKHGEHINYFLQNSNTNGVDVKGRRTSFSAASGANYSSFSSRPDATYSGAVEFSTPQLLPVDHSSNSTFAANNANNNGNNNWMSDLSNIPGLDFLNNFSLSDAAAASHGTDQIDSVGPTTIVQNRSGSQSGFGSDVGSIVSGGTATATANANGASPSTGSRQKARKASKKNEGNDIFGYSFYDDDFTLSNQMDDFHNMKLSYPKLPSTYLTDNSSPDGRESSSNSNLNTFNEYELLSELEIPNYEEKILSVGYSFYESNDFASSTISPSVLAWRSGLRNNNKLPGSRLKHSNTDPMDVDSPEVSKQQVTTNEQLLSGFNSLPGDLLSKDELFTPNLLSKIHIVLNEYPFVGLPPPDLPPIEQINEFVENFKSRFLSHYPFIHKTFLNENSMFEYTKSNDEEEEPIPEDYSSFVCLPLLVGTIGALYSNERKLAADLYEISRRCIHVYLDSRKKSEDSERSTTHNSPLWLVQSLVLSVFYGLFAEFDESDLSVILRQVNALCTLIKVSKFNLVKFDHENIEINKEYFNDYVLYQSKIRTVFMIFNISNILTCVYDLAPFIKYKEIKCDLPDLENFWECFNVSQFKVKCVENSSITYSLNLEKILNDMLMNNVIQYKVSEFGANILMFTVLQYFYFNKKNSLTNFSAGISPYHSNSSNLVKNFKWEELLINEAASINVESIILKNIAVMRSLQIDISKIKQMMWTRNWRELSVEFINLNPKNDDLLDACDYSIRSLSLVFINDESSSNFKRSLSLSCQFYFFNFLYIAKFLHRFERRMYRHSIHPINKSSLEYKQIPKNFSIYLKIAKFLADLEQIFIKNFNYHDVESKLALKDFDPTRYNFGVPPKLLETEYPRDVNVDQVVKVVRLRLSSNILKIGEFVFNLIYEKEMNFNIFKSLSDGLFHLRVHLESDSESSTTTT